MDTFADGTEDGEAAEHLEDELLQELVVTKRYQSNAVLVGRQVPIACGFSLKAHATSWCPTVGARQDNAGTNCSLLRRLAAADQLLQALPLLRAKGQLAPRSSQSLLANFCTCDLPKSLQ
jgi:hypothetical protein